MVDNGGLISDRGCSLKRRGERSRKKSGKRLEIEELKRIGAVGRHMIKGLE